MIIEANASEGVDLPAPRGRFLLGPRFPTGPLRTVKRSGPSGAAKGAVVGGLVGLAVLAAFSLPLVLAQVEPRPAQRQAEAPRPVPAQSAAAPVPKPVPAETVPIAPAAFEPPPAPAPKGGIGASSRSALSLDSLPTLTQEAADIDLDPVSAPTPPPRQSQKPAAQRRSAPPKP